MWKDPIVEEVRRIRDEHAKKFNYDLHAICEDIRKRQSLSGNVIVSRQARRPALVPAVLVDEDDGITEARHRSRELDDNPSLGCSWDEIKQGLGK